MYVSREQRAESVSQSIFCFLSESIHKLTLSISLVGAYATISISLRSSRE